MFRWYVSCRINDHQRVRNALDGHHYPIGTMDVMLNLMFYGFIAIFDAPHKRASPLMINLNMEFYLTKHHTHPDHIFVYLNGSKSKHYMASSQRVI